MTMLREAGVEGGRGIGNFLVFASGVMVGLLVATKPGRETREQIADFFRQGKARSQEYLRKGQEQLQNVKERMSGEGGKEPYYESGKYT